MEQNNWINEVLESTTGLQKAEPSPFLFEKVSQRIAQGKTRATASNSIKWGFAMATVVVVTLNVIVMSNYIGNNSSTSNNSELVSTLSSELGYNTNYNY